MTTIVSIYQAGESLYKLFDKVCVIYTLFIVYLTELRIPAHPSRLEAVQRVRVAFGAPFRKSDIRELALR